VTNSNANQQQLYERKKKNLLREANDLLNKGHVSNYQGKFAEALNVYENALDILLKVLGNRHAGVAYTYNNIGGILICQGKYEEAMKVDEKALEIQLETLGNRHQHVAESYNNIGSALNGLEANMRKL